MSDRAKIVWKSIGVSVVALILIAAFVWGYLMSPTSEPCRAIHYTIADRSERMYITEQEIDELLRSQDLYPVHRQQNMVSLYRIESAISHHPMVREAECYMNPRFEVQVYLTQRVPLLRVQTPGDTYFIDEDRRVMPYRSAVKDRVLLVTGTVGTQMASSQLADFAMWLRSDRYWRKRIYLLDVKSPNMVYLYLKDEAGKVQNERIVLGNMRGYEKKLAKLRTFQENSDPAIQDKHYSELDIRFEGQVIGRN